jgi:hypothetical protein
MSENQSLLQQLEEILHWKKSKQFYADKLGITEFEVDELLKELRNQEKSEEDAEVGNYIAELENVIVKFTEDISKGVGEVVANFSEEVKSLQELIEKCHENVTRNTSFRREARPIKQLDVFVDLPLRQQFLHGYKTSIRRTCPLGRETDLLKQKFRSVVVAVHHHFLNHRSKWR